MAAASEFPRAFEMLESRLLFSIAAGTALALVSPGCDQADNTVAAKPATTKAAAGAAAADAIQYSAPITITSGGTYSGNWESTDPNVPAVTIKTSDPVIIENSNIRSASDGIRCRWGNSNLTVRNTTGIGVNPNVAGDTPGRFVDLQFFVKGVVENCYLEGTGGIYFNEYQGDGSAGQAITVRYNVAKNIDGRKSDGAGGWQHDQVYMQFVQVNNSHGMQGAEIAWNQVINDPRNSRVEDNISIHLSDGTAEKPILIHDNYIQGAYAIDPANDTFSGGGIMLMDGANSDPALRGGHVRAYNNQVISTSNYGIAISAGSDCQIYNNRVIMAGTLDDGTKLKPLDAGIYIRNYANYPTFQNNTAHDNVVGWGRADGSRWDLSLQAATPSADSINNTALPNPITTATEDAEYTSWQAKVAAAGVKLGVQSATAGTTIPALNSNPGASHTLYLDFDGDTTVSTPPFAGTTSNIQEIFERVSEKFSPFDLNVTTVNPGTLKANVSGRILIGGGIGINESGGYAIIGGFRSDGATGYTYSINLANDPHYIGENVAHEAAHLFGLDHQNGPNGEVYNPGDSFTAPIMGTSYLTTRGLWWNGPSGGHTQDDLSILDNTLGRRADQHGIIERVTDTDSYEFTTDGGQVNLTLSVPKGAMLDAKGMLYDSAGNLLGERDRKKLGELAQIFVGPGTYRLVVASHGAYGDIGQYTLTGSDGSGSLDFVEVADGAVSAPPMVAQAGTIIRSENKSDEITVDVSDLLKAA